MGNCNSCTCNDKNEVTTFEVQTDAGKLSNVQQEKAAAAQKRSQSGNTNTVSSSVSGQRQNGKVSASSPHIQRNISVAALKPLIK